MANIMERISADNKTTYTARIRIKGYRQQTATFPRIISCWWIQTNNHCVWLWLIPIAPECIPVFSTRWKFCICFQITLHTWFCIFSWRIVWLWRISGGKSHEMMGLVLVLRHVRI